MLIYQAIINNLLDSHLMWQTVAFGSKNCLVISLNWNVLVTSAILYAIKLDILVPR